MALSEPESKIKRPLRRKLLIALAAYLVCWGLTYWIGPIQAEAWLEGRMDPTIKASTRLPSLNHQIMLQGITVDSPKYPWYFIGNTRSPCPFVFSHDLACALGKEGHGNGYAERAYYFWFFGYLYPIGTIPYWTHN